MKFKGGVFVAAIYIDLQPDVLNWIIQKTQFENISDSVIDTLIQWQNGIEKPTFNKIKDISRKTHIPLGYFFMQTPIQEDISLVQYRTVDSEALMHPSRNLIDTVQSMQRVQDWMEEYCKDNGADTLPFVGSLQSNENYKMIAEDIRNVLELSIDWFKNYQNSALAFKYLRELITKSGVMVMGSGIVGNSTHRKIDVKELRAFTLVNKYAPLIFINYNDSDNGKLFSLLHELAHIWIGCNSLYNVQHINYTGDNRIEQICNTAAAEILVPDILFKEKWNSVSGDIMQRLKLLSSNYFKCSRFVILLKAFDNGFINRDTLNHLFNELNKDYKKQIEAETESDNKRRGGGNYYKNLASRWDTRFIKALSESTVNGDTLFTDAYRLTGVKGKNFNKFVQEVISK